MFWRHCLMLRTYLDVHNPDIEQEASFALYREWCKVTYFLALKPGLPYPDSILRRGLESRPDAPLP